MESHRALDDDVVVSRRPDVLWRVVPGYLVVATLDDDVFEATGSAPDIWCELDGSITVAMLIASLAELYDLEPEQIRTDVIAFLGELQAAELLTIDW